MNISLKKIWTTILLSKHEYGSHMSNLDIQRYLRIDESNVRRCLERYAETDNVEVIQKSGRKWSTKDKQDAIIQPMVDQHSTVSVGKIACILPKKDMNSGGMTLRRRLKETDIQPMNVASLLRVKIKPISQK